METSDPAADPSVTSADALRTPSSVTSVLQELLRYGYIEQNEKPNLYRDGQLHLEQVNSTLEALAFRVQVDETRGLLVLKLYDQATSSAEIDSAWSHPLVRRQRLTLEQSLLTAILRRRYLLSEQDKGIGMQSVKVFTGDLENELSTFTGDSGSDQRNERRLLENLAKLKEHGLVSAPDANNDVTIRPLIVHLADPASLSALLQQFQSQSQSQS